MNAPPIELSERVLRVMRQDLERAKEQDVWKRGHFQGRTTDDTVEMIQGWTHRSGKYGLTMELVASFGVDKKSAYRYTLMVLVNSDQLAFEHGALAAGVVRSHADAARVVEAYEAIGFHEALIGCLKNLGCSRMQEQNPDVWADYKRISMALSAPSKVIAWPAIEAAEEWVMEGEDLNEVAGRYGWRVD